MSEHLPAGSEHASPKEEPCEPREIPEEKIAQAESLLPDVRDAVAVVRPQRDGHWNGVIGAGWFLNDTYAVTNAHVMGQQDTAKLWTVNETSLTATKVANGRENNRDVAVLKITDGTPPNTLTLGESASLSKGEYILLIGHPGLMGYWVPTIGTYVKRHSINFKGETPDWYQNIEYHDLVCDVPATGGNSGSPLLTLDGKVVGIHWGGGFEEVGPAVHTPTSDKVHTEFPYQERLSQSSEPIEAVMEVVNKAG